MTAPPFPEYLIEHEARSATADEVPYTALCVAENRLVWDILEPKIRDRSLPPPEALGYDLMIGSEAFRRELARFMSRGFLGRSVDASQLVVLAGAGCVLETMFYGLCDSGDGVLIPTPSYAGFWMDLETRDQLQIVPVHRRIEDGFRLSAELLDSAVAEAGIPIKALVFTSPDNPLGKVFDRDEIEEILGWAERAGVHVVFDEIYALSVFGERPFTSVASLRPALGEMVHIVWAFSKDFAASGLRCGVLVSENEALIHAIDGLAYWACCSGDTQFLLGEMVADEAWVDRYVGKMQERLGNAYRSVTAVLGEYRVPYVSAEAGFFFLLDLRSYLSEPSWQAEHELWCHILDATGVNLTPGAACRCGEPGFMRLCYAGVSVEEAVPAVKRLGRALQALGSRSK